MAAAVQRLPPQKTAGKVLTKQQWNRERVAPTSLKTYPRQADDVVIDLIVVATRSAAITEHLRLNSVCCLCLRDTKWSLRLPRQVLLWRYLDVLARPGVLQSSQCALTLYLGFQHRVLELLLLTGNSVLVSLNFLPLLFLQTVHGTSLELLQVRLNSVSSLRLRHCPPELHVPCRSLSGIDIRILGVRFHQRKLVSAIWKRGHARMAMTRNYLFTDTCGCSLGRKKTKI